MNEKNTGDKPSIISEQNLETKQNTFVVYQFGKVASTSIVNSFNDCEDTIAYQSHFLGENMFRSSLDRLMSVDLDDYSYFHTEGQLIQNIRINRMINRFKVDNSLTQNLYFLSLSRDPIDYMRSVLIQDFVAYYEQLKVLYPDLYKDLNNQEFVKSTVRLLLESFIDLAKFCGGVDNVDQNSLSKYYKENRRIDAFKEKLEKQFMLIFLRPFNWFESHFSNFLGFRKENMEKIDDNIFYHKLNWCTVYIIRYEDLHKSMNQLLKLTNISEGFQMQNKNISSDKYFAEEISEPFKDNSLRQQLYEVSKSGYTDFFDYRFK